MCLFVVWSHRLPWGIIGVIGSRAHYSETFTVRLTVSPQSLPAFLSIQSIQLRIESALLRAARRNCRTFGEETEYSTYRRAFTTALATSCPRDLEADMASSGSSARTVHILIRSVRRPSKSFSAKLLTKLYLPLPGEEVEEWRRRLGKVWQATLYWPILGLYPEKTMACCLQ